jgi:DNA-binding protein Fis
MLRNDRQQEIRIDIPAGLTLKQVESAIVRQTLDRCRGNRTHAAKLLGVSVRTLQRQLNRWERVPA